MQTLNYLTLTKKIEKAKKYRGELIAINRNTDSLRERLETSELLKRANINIEILNRQLYKF